jgi:Amt family ammonium transporter
MEVDTGTTAWLLTASSLVLLMTPGLALFYGGMTRSRGILNMIMMSFGALGLVSVLWVLYGYSVAFGTSQGGWVGDPTEYLGLQGLLAEDKVTAGLPDMAFVGFQAVFAVVTVALVSGAIADRAKFTAWMIFAGAWATVVYFPVAHWVFAFQGENLDEGGWIGSRGGTIDLAGGTAVHVNAGAAALALALVLGKRRGFGREPMRPGNLPLVMLGAGLLWFGWFGFNAASTLASDGRSAYVWINTFVAAAAGMLGWLLVERIRDSKPTSLGAASGVVAGLVAITPGCGAVTPLGAIAIGVLAGVVCAFAVGLKYRLGYDDSLDVVGVHLVGGLLGTYLIFFFASADAWYYGRDGLLYGGGGADLAYDQFIPPLVVLAYSFVVTFVLGWIVHRVIGFRVPEDDEAEGVDLTEHAETAYDFASIGGSGFAVRRVASAKSEVKEGATA